MKNYFFFSTLIFFTGVILQGRDISVLRKIKTNKNTYSSGLALVIFSKRSFYRLTVKMYLIQKQTEDLLKKTRLTLS
jgi:hypothetical protein